MATYFNGNSEGGDGLQTLFLMNPGYVYYNNTHQSTQSQSGNFDFLDSNHPVNNNNNNNPVTSKQLSITDSRFGNMAVPSAETPQLIGVPLAVSPPPSRHQYMYTPVEMVAAPQRDVTPFQQGLSLSLSSQQSRYAKIPISPTGDDRSAVITGGGDGGGSVSNVNGMHNMILNSKYLKATQEILEEVVNAGQVVKNTDQAAKNLKIIGGDGGSPVTGEGETTTTTTKSGRTAELTTAERQEIQMKKSKLVNMLDEVEQRYRQYHNQMKLVISWFEQVAGIGSAKTYTALALQTISKQFRCLKGTIIGQIKAVNVNLGEEDGSNGGSRLKYVDNQIRQQRALQQLGMIQQNAWRPQRGLPERAVSVLRAWLFEHFLHPYPKDSDKHMLAKQTGLTRSQVSNWFINARVRLWKPMVEEMYLEEIKDQEPNQMEADKTNTNHETEENSSSKLDKMHSPENSNKGLIFQPTKQEKPFHLPPSMTVSTTISTPPTATGISFQNPSGFSLIGPLEMDQITSFSPKKPRNELHQQTQDAGFTVTGNNPTDFIGGLGGYPIGEIGRFTTDQFQQHYSGNGVSLTLGLPHCENLSISNSQQNFLPNQTIQQENSYTAMNPPSSSHTAALYESMNIQNRKRFGAQPLPDFVA